MDGRLNLLEVDVESVREHQGLALAEVRQKRLAVDLPLTLVGGEHHHHVGGLCGLFDGKHAKAGGLGFIAGRASRIESHDDVDAALFQVQSMRMALAAVTDDRNLLTLQPGNVTVLLVIYCRHSDNLHCR